MLCTNSAQILCVFQDNALHSEPLLFHRYLLKPIIYILCALLVVVMFF